MKTKQVHTANRLVVVSLTYFVLALMLLSTVLYAWFSLTNTNRALVTSHISGVEAEYEFYVFNNSMKDGAEGKNLTDNTCLVEDEDMCYEYIVDPNTITLIDGFTAPGERYSFAVKIRSVGNSGGKLRMDLAGVISFGHDLNVNQIQTAFQYQTTMITYVGLTGESEDVKDSMSLDYQADYFNPSVGGPYYLVKDIPFGLTPDVDDEVIIYFDLYFDPTIYGQNALGQPYENSNIFMGQNIRVNFIIMTIYS